MKNNNYDYEYMLKIYGYGLTKYGEQKTKESVIYTRTYTDLKRLYKDLETIKNSFHYEKPSRAEILKIRTEIIESLEL